MSVRSRVITTLVVLGVVGGGLSGCEELASYDAGATREVTTVEGPSGSKPDRSEKDRSKKKAEKRTRQESRPVAVPAPTPKPRTPRTFLVSFVVDGDTVDLANGERVRLVGIDTPEQGECGSDAATANLAGLVLGERVRLRMSDEDRDGYGRLLRYVDVGGVDAGLRQIEAGLAVARYDSRDGYGYHPRENRYVAADMATPDKRCGQPEPVPLVQAPAQAPAGCETGYQPCVPVFPPDVDCADVNGPVRVTGPDPHGLDGDGDGFACES